MVSSCPDSAPAWTQWSRHSEGSGSASRGWDQRPGRPFSDAVFPQPGGGRSKLRPEMGRHPRERHCLFGRNPRSMFSRPHTPPHCSPRPCPPPPSVSTPEFSLFRAMRVAALTFISLIVQDGKSEEEGQGGQADPHRSGCRPATGPGLG